MSLQTRLQDLATRVSTQCKTINTMLNGNAPNNSALLTTTKTSLLAAINELKEEIDDLATAGGATINDGSSSSTTQTWSITKIADEIEDAATALKADLLGGAGAAYDTLQELAALIGDNADGISAINTALSNRLRFDAAQSLSAPQRVQGNANLGSASLVQIGDPDTNFVTTFEAGLD